MKLVMIRWSYWAALPLLGMVLLAVSGCATSEEKTAFLNAQLEALKMQKPLLELRAKAGEQIELRGVESLAVYAPLGGGNGGGLVRQHQNEWAPVAREGLGILGVVGGIYFAGEKAVQLADVVGRNAGTHITGSFNNTGGQSPISYYVGQGGAPSQGVSDSHDSTDDHSSQVGESPAQGGQ
ncbi:MAG: hypothetical protein LDL07_00530 [Desulfarculus sp.]|nr:hypothetical protein [Desulfarculus sp.]